MKKEPTYRLVADDGKILVDDNGVERGNVAYLHPSDNPDTWTEKEAPVPFDEVDEVTGDGDLSV